MTLLKQEGILVVIVVILSASKFAVAVPNMVLSLQNAAVKYFQPVLLQCTVTRYVYSDGDTVGFFVEKPSGDFEAKSLVRYEGITCNKIAPISDNIYIKCPPDSAVPYSAIKKYVMTMKKLLLTSSAHGWICCINNCSYAQSNYINLAPYTLNLTYSSQVGQFVLLGDSVDLWCHRVGYDYFVGTVEMFKENERCAYLLYSADKCEIKILKSGYEFACENKTNPQRGMSVFTIKDVKQDDFKMWRCMHKESAMTSPVLDLRQKMCRRLCAHGGTLNDSTCICECPGMWGGDTCETCNRECGFDNKPNHTNCNCNCREYTTGPLCDVCRIKDCDAGGAFQANTCRCDCPKERSGYICEHCNHHCQHGGRNNEKTCKCECDRAWTGSYCEECKLEVEDCLHDSKFIYNECRCRCKNSWFGYYCDKCSSYTHCSHGATFDEQSCSCLCTGGWSGRACDDCSLDCHNGATYHQDVCKCLCPHGWKGLQCEKEIIINKTPERMVGGLNETAFAVIIFFAICIVGGSVYGYMRHKRKQMQELSKEIAIEEINYMKNGYGDSSKKEGYSKKYSGKYPEQTETTGFDNSALKLEENTVYSALTTEEQGTIQSEAQSYERQHHEKQHYERQQYEGTQYENRPYETQHHERQYERQQYEEPYERQHHERQQYEEPYERQHHEKQQYEEPYKRQHHERQQYEEPDERQHYESQQYERQYEGPQYEQQPYGTQQYENPQYERQQYEAQQNEGQTYEEQQSQTQHYERQQYGAQQNEGQTYEEQQSQTQHYEKQ